MKIALISAKGGCGKTTATALLFLALREAGHAVAVEDRDPQRTLSRCLEAIGAEPDAEREADVVLIDTPPRLDGREIFSAAAAADRILIPSRPGPADLWAAQETAAALQERGQAEKARILWNAIRPGTILSRSLDDAQKTIGIKAIKAGFHLREAYAQAFLLGLSALDREAREEIAAVALAALAKR
jgi:chromosome partitioning protein